MVVSHRKRSKPNVPRIKEEKTDDLQSPKSDVVKRAPPAPVRRPDVKHTTKASSKRTPIDVPVSRILSDVSRLVLIMDNRYSSL